MRVSSNVRQLAVVEALEDEHEAAARDALAAVAQAAGEADAAGRAARVREARIVLEAGTRTETPRAAPSAPPEPAKTRR